MPWRCERVVYISHFLPVSFRTLKRAYTDRNGVVQVLTWAYVGNGNGTCKGVTEQQRAMFARLAEALCEGPNGRP